MTKIQPSDNFNFFLIISKPVPVAHNYFNRNHPKAENESEIAVI